MKPEYLQILQHSLGLDRYGQGDPYRNRYAVGPGCDSWDACKALCDAGMMTDHGAQEWMGGMHAFTVTDFGKEAVRKFSPAPPKLSRSQRRYRQYLRSEVDYSFGEWLQMGLYKQYV